MSHALPRQHPFFLHSWQQGKTLVEFALLIPVVLMLLIAVIDFGRILFTYAQAVNQLREGLRYAEVLGTSSTQNYLDCSAMRDTISNVFFATIDRREDITITYINAHSPDPAHPETHLCGETGSVAADEIASGDILKIELTARIPVLVIPGYELTLDFSGQRTIIKSIRIGALSQDNDQDGLNDLWEKSYFADQQNALGDPDGGGCNNGCEELRGSDPTLNDSQNPDPGLAAGMTVPPAPNGFLASRDCASQRVTFSWSAPSGASTRPFHANNRPFPDFARIYQVGSSTPVLEINPLSGGACTGCASILPYSAQDTYYLVFYKRYQYRSESESTQTWVARSVSSPFSTATCDPPAAPAFFVAQADCALGVVNFSWQPPSPTPDAYEIYRSDGRLVRTITDGHSQVCWSCDTIGSNETVQYWIVARLGTQTAPSTAPFAEAQCGAGSPVVIPEENSTPPPDPDDGTTPAATPPPTTFPGGCGASGPQGGTYAISGHIFLDQNGNGKQAGTPEPDLDSIGVRIIWAGEDNNFDTVCDNGNPIDQYTNQTGNFLFDGLRPGLYRIELINIEAHERVTTGNYPNPTITLGPDRTLIFGLQ